MMLACLKKALELLVMLLDVCTPRSTVMIASGGNLKAGVCAGVPGGERGGAAAASDRGREAVP